LLRACKQPVDIQQEAMLAAGFTVRATGRRLGNPSNRWAAISAVVPVTRGGWDLSGDADHRRHDPHSFSRAGTNRHADQAAVKACSTCARPVVESESRLTSLEEVEAVTNI